MKPNHPDKETADILKTIFDNLFESSGAWMTPVIAQIDEVRLYFKDNHPCLDRQEPDDIVRCWVWKDGSHQLCSISHYLEQREAKTTEKHSYGLEFVIKRIGPDQVYVAFFSECLDEDDPIFNTEGLGFLEREEGKWIPKQFFPDYWHY